MAYSQEIADKICERLAAGESLRKACREIGCGVQTILDWTVANEAFGGQYAQAREAGYALLADELVEIADDSTNDTTVTEDGKVVTNQEVVARSRLRVDTRKWMLSKMLPKVYGEKLELAGLVTVKASPADLTDEQLAAIALGRKQNILPAKVSENTGLDPLTLENCPDGDNQP